MVNAVALFVANIKFVLLTILRTPFSCMIRKSKSSEKGGFKSIKVPVLPPISKDPCPEAAVLFILTVPLNSELPSPFNFKTSVVDVLLAPVCTINLM